MKKNDWLKVIRNAAVKHYGTRVKRVYPVGAEFKRLTVTGYERQLNGCWAVLCHCVCGRDKKVLRPNQMRRGLVGSCGCLNRELASARFKGKEPFGIRPEGAASFTHLFRSYARSAMLRGYSFELTEQEFRCLTQDVCAFCGEPPAQENKGRGHFNGVYIYNGIDRLDPALGYTLDNCVPCCKQCNRAKRKLTAKQFMSWVLKAADHIRKQDYL